MELTKKKKEHVLIISGVLTLVILFVGAFIVNLIIQKEERIWGVLGVTVFAVFSAGIFAIKKLARNDKERIWGASGFSMLIVILVGFFFALRLKEIGTMKSLTDFITYFFSLPVPISLATGFLTYEILYSRKVKRSVSFHIKRFLGRMVFAIGFTLCFMAVWNILYLLFSHLLSDRYLLLSTGLVMAITFYSLTKIHRLKHFFSKLESGR